MKDSEDTWTSIISSAYNGESTGKTAYTGGLILGKILYSAGYGTGGNYAAGANTSAIYEAFPFSFRYSSNCATTLTASKPVYLVGTVNITDGLFYLDTTQWWTQTEPTSEDGKVYILVGQAYSTYQVWLATENTAYQYYDGQFQKLEDIETKIAKTAADDARESADNAAAQAALAASSASQALSNAAQAQTAANSAFSSATTAYNQLSQVQQVIDVLNWAAEHGTYTQTTDTSVQNGVYYFTLSDGKYQLVTNPSGNPHAQGWYVLTGTDASISTYIATHLALTDDGLFIQLDDSSTRLQITGTGIYLWTPSGRIAQYTSEVVLGAENGVHIVLSPTNGLEFYEGEEKVAWITSNVLHISQAEIESSLRVGKFMWKVQGSNRISLVYSPS